MKKNLQMSLKTSWNCENDLKPAVLHVHYPEIEFRNVWTVHIPKQPTLRFRAIVRAKGAVEREVYRLEE